MASSSNLISIGITMYEGVGAESKEPFVRIGLIEKFNLDHVQPMFGHRDVMLQRQAGQQFIESAVLDIDAFAEDALSVGEATNRESWRHSGSTP
jgi:hypothetical protein